MSKILVNALMCPDGTIIESRHRHDFKSHVNINEDGSEGERSFVDGGTDYTRYSNGTLITITDDMPFEVVRMFLSRGGRGKDGRQPLRYVPLFAMSNSWLENLVEYEETNRPNNPYLPFYKKEVEYRFDNQIFIKDV